MSKYFGILVVSMLCDIIFLIIGICLKKYNCAEIISGYDPEVDDKKEVSLLFGNLMLLTGFLIIAIGFIYICLYFFVDGNILLELIDYYAIGTFVIVIVMCIKMYFQMNKLRKHKKSS